MLRLFALGALLGPLGDFFHIVSGTNGYTTKGLLWPIPGLGVPAWVPLEFGLAVLCVGASHIIFDQYFFPGRTRPGEKSAGLVFLGLVFIIGFWAASAFLPWPTGRRKDLVLALGTLAAWWILERTGAGIVLALMTVAVGLAVEILLIRMDIFHWFPESGNILGVPTWLPWLYILTSIAVGNLARRLAK